jgi:hypothetical protein
MIKISLCWFMLVHIHRYTYDYVLKRLAGRRQPLVRHASTGTSLNLSPTTQHTDLLIHLKYILDLYSILNYVVFPSNGQEKKGTWKQGYPSTQFLK